MQQETILGREPSSDIVLRDREASRRHARIFVQESAYWIEDLHSLNGTFVNGKAVTLVRLEPSDSITIGSISMTFLIPDAMPPVEPAPVSSTA